MPALDAGSRPGIFDDEPLVRFLAARQRDQHRHLLAIATVLIAEQVDQIALLEPDADQDIAGGRDREQQMAGRHGRRRPEGEQEAEIERMADRL